MSAERRYQYFVEGETEKKLINELKKEGNLIIPGTIRVFNVVNQKLTAAMLANISSNTTAILVFDTDKKSIDILRDNISKLRQNKSIQDIWCVMQVKNFEEELIRSTDVKSIKDLLGSKSNKEFKKDFIKEKNLLAKLYNHYFNLEKMWIMTPGEEFKEWRNDGDKIKR